QNVTATVNFKLTDAGEPGTSDTAYYKITLSDGTVVLDSLLGATGFDPAIKLTFGNHQVHPELKNLLNPAAASVEQQITKTFGFLDNSTISAPRLNTLTQTLLAQFAAFNAAVNGATVSGIAFVDSNHDGIQELGEGGLA